MPNHVKNRIEIKGTPEQVESIIKAFGTHHNAKLSRAYDGTIICKRTDTDEFRVGWFNEQTGVFKRRGEKDVMGLPEGWEFEINGSSTQFPDFKKVIPQPGNIFNENLSAEDERRCKEQGIPTWYDWNRQNWGTKWNSYSCEKESWNIYTFETAWSPVPRIIQKISETYSDVEFVYSYADEDTGYNCGSIRFRNGKRETEFYPKGGSKEAYDIAFELRPDSSKYYTLKDGKYEYIEE